MEKIYVNPRRTHNRDYFFKYTTAATAKIIIATKFWRWSSPQLFNDPFDVPRELYVGVDLQELQDGLFDEVARIIELPNPIDISGQPLLQVMVNIVRRTGDKDKIRVFAEGMRRAKGEVVSEASIQATRGLQKVWDDMHPNLRILCLSEEPDNTPMWNHYSDKYRGTVLAFHCSDERDSPLLLARKVVYQDERPRMASIETWIRYITGQKGMDFKSLLEEHLYVKTKEWEYEREWRVVSHAVPGEEGLHSDYPFNSRDLVSVYLGPRIDAHDEADIRALLDKDDYRHVEIYKGRIEDGERRITFQLT